MQKIQDLSIFGFGFHGNTFILVGKRFHGYWTNYWKNL